MNPNLASQSTPDDAVIKLKCPECSGGLNLRRKHLGIRGKCVHCKAPITAVEEDGVIFLKLSRESAPSPKPAATETPAPAPVAEAPPLIEPAVVPTGLTKESISAPDPSPREIPADLTPPATADGDLESRFIPPPIPQAREEDSASATEEENLKSAWGFPTREEDSIAPIAPRPKPAENEDVEAPASSVEKEPKEEPVGSGLPEGFGFSEAPSFSLGGTASGAGETESESPTLPSTNPSDLFESKTDSTEVPHFSNEEESGELNAGWGAKVPDQNHASISPFSTGSAEPDPGFAETLFREKAKEETGKIEPKSPFGEIGAPDDAPVASGALFSDSVTQRIKPPAPAPKPDQEKEVVLDGDGRPLREMTPEEKERFAKDIMTFSQDRRKSSPWLRRIFRFFVTMAVLGGIGYAAYVFMPEEQVEAAKAKVFDWLEPGSVLLDYLPFDVAESENGEKEIKIKALEGLDNLSNQMDSYLSTAEDQLNETLPEGAEGFKHESPIEMPEMPKVPNIPGVKMPPMPGIPNSGEEAAAQE
ncbi:MAG: hypothetical protein AAF491_05375 [Verrucomicrobiota bacterium]